MALDDDAVERYCILMHEAYEEAAAKEGWETQERSRKPWQEVPEANKATMRHAVAALVSEVRREAIEEVLEEIRAERRRQERGRQNSLHLDTRLTYRYAIRCLDDLSRVLRKKWLD